MVRKTQLAAETPWSDNHVAMGNSYEIKIFLEDLDSRPRGEMCSRRVVPTINTVAFACPLKSMAQQFTVTSFIVK